MNRPRKTPEELARHKARLRTGGKQPPVLLSPAIAQARAKIIAARRFARTYSAFTASLLYLLACIFVGIFG